MIEVTEEMSGGLRHHHDEATGRAMRLDKHHPKEDQYSHGRNQCACAHAKVCPKSYKNEFHVPLTSPTSLEMLKNPHISLIVAQKGEQTAQACDIAWFRQPTSDARFHRELAPGSLPVCLRRAGL
jgi:hypothetical protein